MSKSSRFAYVSVCEIDGVLSFRHLWLNATDEEDAYTQGYEATRLVDLGGPFLNDYVIRGE